VWIKSGLRRRVPERGYAAGKKHTALDYDPTLPKHPPDMLYTIAIVLILLWLLGLVSSYTINGFIHVLLVIAIILLLVRIISGKKPL
jgi:hypothetical protein